jgi:hypothetical protein
MGLDEDLVHGVAVLFVRRAGAGCMLTLDGVDGRLEVRMSEAQALTMAIAIVDLYVDEFCAAPDE